VYSAGAIAPLIEYGFSNAFEHVIGSNAGAINARVYLDVKEARLRLRTPSPL